MVTKVIFIFRKSVFRDVRHISIHKKYNHSRQLYSDTKLYSFQGTVSVRSRKYIYLRNIYSFKFKAICSFNRAVASVRQGGQMPPPLNFGPEVQYFDEFLKKAGLYALFLYCHSE